MINGNIVLLLYDVFILCLFMFQVYLYRKQDYINKRKKDFKEIPFYQQFSFKLIKAYDRHGILTVNMVLFVIISMLGLIFHALSLKDTTVLFVFFIVYACIMLFVKKLFIGINRFEDYFVCHCIDAVFYLILGICIIVFIRFISMPSIHLVLSGLIIALLLCFFIMLRAIINPMTLHRPSVRNYTHQYEWGMLKGMGILISCVFFILYLMIFSCWKYNPALYYCSTSKIDAIDLIYYLFTSFSTIGYGDILPVRVDGLFQSRFVAIIISLSSIFTTGCFIGAVVGGATANHSDHFVE